MRESSRCTDRNERGLNPLLETLGLIYMTKNFEAVKADTLKSLEEMKIDSRQFYKQYLSYLESYVHEFEAAACLDSSEEFFFGYHAEFFLIIAAAAAELFEAEERREALDRQQILSVLGEFLKETETGEGEILSTGEEWFAALSASEYSEDTKWRFLELLHEPVEKFRQLFMTYEKNKAAFAHTYQKNRSCLDKLISDAPAEPSEAARRIADEFYPKQKKIYLTAALPLIEWVTPAIIFQGVLADKTDLYQKELKNAKERLPQILKLLGDKSKFEILCLLKSHGKYNLEIAEELQLTPATASHHMSMLLSNQMVTVEKKEGKVYYRLNKETLREIMKCLEEVFL